MFNTQNLYQNDPNWKDTKLGHSSESIGSWGCLLTSATMVVNGLGYNETPATVNEKMKTAGGFQGALFVPSKLSYVFPNVVYKGMEACESYPAPIAQIDAALAAGKPVIAQVDWNPDAGIQTHFVLLKEKKGEDYVLYDPYKYRGDGPEKEILLTVRYKHQGPNVANAISGILWFDGIGTPPAPPPKKEPIPLPAEKFVVYAIEDDLAMRADPSTGGYLMKRLTAKTELISLEQKDIAKAKISQTGMWLQVQDPKGDQGYVAAWYVSTDKEAKPAPPATPPAQPATTGTTVTTTTPATSVKPSTTPLPPGSMALLPTEEVAFRTQPLVSADTLIRRIPPTEQLASLEPSSQVIGKVGVQGQWIKVRDASSRDGYVAAWYVKYASGSTTAAASAATPPATAGAPITVKTTVEGVAFRKQPIISDATLIRRLPLGTQISITEAGGESKIGANNQWIKVKDAGGTEGYIAAWFVAR